MKRKIKLMIAAIALLMMAASCSKDDPATVPVEVSDVTLNKTELTLAVGDSETLTATVTPADAVDQTITWSSSAPAVATVSNGAVTALTAGETTITATTANGKTATCEVTVVILPSIEFTFTLDNIEFEVNARSMTVDWGDGFSDEFNDELLHISLSHSYSNYEEHTVRIYAHNLTYFNCFNKR
ncbi:MAG: Ig-like domain-containing protein, partial [Prevotellaceae bacterium]|nr:Ig-like domain-containing protein [Prevotellaceae bacterium]